MPILKQLERDLSIEVPKNFEIVETEPFRANSPELPLELFTTISLCSWVFNLVYGFTSSEQVRNDFLQAKKKI